MIIYETLVLDEIYHPYPSNAYDDDTKRILNDYIKLKNDYHPEAYIGELGELGWKLAAVYTMPMGYDNPTRKQRFVFQRESSKGRLVR